MVGVCDGGLRCNEVRGLGGSGVWWGLMCVVVVLTMVVRRLVDGREGGMDGYGTSSRGLHIRV